MRTLSTIGVILICSCFGVARAGGQKDPCSKFKTSILVSGQESELYLCQKGRSIGNFAVAFGSKGLGKAKHGDRKTPVGTYRLGRPRPSSKYGTFIPIQIPASMGSAVGIHGPARSTSWLGPLNTLFDWTAGCIALGRDSYVEEVARFIRRYPKMRIHIRPPAHWAREILKQTNTQLKTGDLIFQTSKTKVALTVFGSTGSVLTHVGLIVVHRNTPMVMEAVGPVKWSPLNRFVNRGMNGYFVVKRPKTPLTSNQKKRLVRAARRFLGRGYDGYFRWDDSRQYCSEFVYKSYARGLNLKLARLEKIKDLYDSWNPFTYFYVRRVYKKRRVNPNEPIITPQRLYDSSYLETVIDTYPI